MIDGLKPAAGRAEEPELLAEDGLMGEDEAEGEGGDLDDLSKGATA